MAGDALFVGWGQIVRGREQLGLQVFQETVAYYGRLQEEGKIERWTLGQAWFWFRCASATWGHTPW